MTTEAPPTPFADPAVADAFASYPPVARQRLLALRELVFETARSIPEVDGVQETLKWGEPAYLTTNGVGSTLRMAWKDGDPGRCALFFHCGTDLVDTFRSLFPDEFTFEGNRALVVPLDGPLPDDAVRTCIEGCLTYHLDR